MDNVAIAYPAWFLILCLSAGLAVSLILYFRNKRLNDKKGWSIWSLAILRFLSVSLLAALLLSPILKNRSEQIEKPIVVMAVDQSSSVKAETDSLTMQQFEEEWSRTATRLGQNFEVVQLGFGSSVSNFADFSRQDESSNMSDVLEYVGDLYGDQNLGALILATDGIYNEGKDPRYANYTLSAPIYPVALGDTTPDRDLTIRQVYSNKIAYLGDESGIQVDLSAFNLASRSATVTVSKVVDGKLQSAGQEAIRINAEDFFTTLDFSLPQDQVGLQQYRVAVTQIQGEKSYRNNRKDFYIDVIDARQKIALLYDHVHPDISAIKSSLENNKNYQVIASRFRDLKTPIEGFDMVILHQLPGKRTNIAPFVERLNALEMPRIFILGEQSNSRLFNQVQDLISYTPKSNAANDVQAVVNGAFSLFKLPEDLQLKLGQFAPVQAPFADYQVNPSAEVLLSQRIGRVDTDFPLLVFKEEGGVKTAVMAAEGLWRWRLYDFLQHDNHQLFDLLLSKTLQFVSVKEDKRKFRVFQTQNLLTENEEALLEAELYNQSYELVNQPDVTIDIFDDQGASFEYTFSRKGDTYILNAGRFSAGNYRWVAACNYEGEQFEAEGRFSVQQLEKEEYNTVADHNLLAGVANASHGRLLHPKDLAEMTEELISGDQLKPIYYEVTKTRSAIHLKWIFFCLILLLVLEWLGRRLLGTY